MNELIVGVCGCALLFVGVVVIQEQVFNSQKKTPRQIGAEKSSSDRNVTATVNMGTATNKNQSSSAESKNSGRNRTQPDTDEALLQLENAITIARKTLQSLGRTEGSNDEPASNSSPKSFIDDLQRLIDMKEKGFLTEVEFVEAKKKVIGKN